MERALPGSALVHVAILGIAVVSFAWPEPEDAPASESVSVSIISTSSITSNATEVIESDSTVDLVSAGAAATSPPALEPVEPETLQPTTETVVPLETETLEPVTEAAVERVAAQSVEPTESEPQQAVEPQPEAVTPIETSTDIAMLSSAAVSPLSSQPLPASEPETIEPVSSEEITLAPVPRVLSFERPSTPTQQPRPQPQKPAEQPVLRQPTLPSGSAGNGGSSNTDVAAAAGGTTQPVGTGNGGEAEIARYSSEVLRKLRRALRSNSGPSGEVMVRFTVLANGQLGSVSVGRSSGNSAIDEAGLATVGRAAPFPAIPAAANRSSWTFDVPLAFGG